MNQKGFANVVVIVGIMVLVGVVGYRIVNKRTTGPSPVPSLNPSPNPNTQTTMPVSISPPNTETPLVEKNVAKQPAYLIAAYSKAGKNYIDVDYVEWLYGDASIKAQVEDGKCVSPDECYDYPNGYKRNQNPLVRTLEVDVNAPIHIAGYFYCIKFNNCSVDRDVIISFDEFRNLASKTAYPNKVNPPFKQPKTIITLDLRDNIVTEIIEPYQE